jgi:uracil-DNA glycosylase
MTEIKALFDAVDQLNYPASMLKVTGQILGRAFFPGGKGTFDNSDIISDKPIMILGQDFDTESNFEKAVEAGQENIKRNATWRNLLKLLEQSGIKPQSCFFTNAIMGVRAENEGTTKNTGKSPAFNHPDFVKQCQEFFLTQLQAQQPKLVLVLGMMPAKFLSDMTEQIKSWKSLNSITAIDAVGHQILEGIRFSDDVTTTLVLLTHPSYRSVNVRARQYKGRTGPEAEEWMLQDMIEKYAPVAPK